MFRNPSGPACPDDTSGETSPKIVKMQYVYAFLQDRERFFALGTEAAAPLRVANPAGFATRRGLQAEGPTRPEKTRRGSGESGKTAGERPKKRSPHPERKSGTGFFTYVRKTIYAMRGDCGRSGIRAALSGSKSLSRRGCSLSPRRRSSSSRGRYPWRLSRRRVRFRRRSFR